MLRHPAQGHVAVYGCSVHVTRDCEFIAGVRVHVSVTRCCIVVGCLEYRCVWFWMFCNRCYLADYC